MSELLPGGVKVLVPQGLDEVEPADLILDLHGVPASARLFHRLPRRSGARIIKVDKQTLLRATLVRRPPLLRGPQTALVRFLGGHERLLSWPQRHLLVAERAFSFLSLSPPERPSSVPITCWSGSSRGGEGATPPPVLGIVLDAAWDLKRWRVAGFRELAVRWHAASGGAIRLFAGPSRTDLFAQIGALPAATCHSSASLVQLARDLDGCDVVVAGDTGPLHLAAALGCGPVALFGPTPVKSGFWVWETRGRLISAPQDCSPCSMHGASPCRRSSQHCLDDVVVGDVLDACLQILEETRRCA
jgi:ADP-heptose:LPS heptosyltransferase